MRERRTRGEPMRAMRAILSWLLAAVTILFSVVFSMQVGVSRRPDEILCFRNSGDSGVAVGVAVGVVKVWLR